MLFVLSHGILNSLTRYMQRAKVKSEFHLETILHKVASLGFIQELENNNFAWAHDQVHQAGYCLIPSDKKEAFHLLIGTRMYMNTPKAELEKNIFDIASHLSLGKRLLESDEQKHEAAELIMLAGQVSLGNSAFHSAASYFMNAVEILG